MGPEMTEKRSEKLVLGLAAKERMSMYERSDSKVAMDMKNGDFCKKTVTPANDVSEKQNVNISVSEGENQDINVTDCANLCEGGNGNMTEEPSGSLSSFNDSVSVGDIDLGLGTSDDEIISEFRGIGQAGLDYRVFEDAFRTRKKKVTRHWRNFIRPIMWRCKWAELQMRKFQIQASMYSKLLEELEQAKQRQKENFCVKVQCSRTVPFPYQMKSRKIIRRIKRKRVENTTDSANYMSQHTLFGYCENKGILADYSHQVRNDLVDVVGNEEALIQFDDEETSLERILSKIDSIQSHIHNLTSRVDNLINENHGRFSSLDKIHLLSTPSDSGPSTAPEPTAPLSDEHSVFITSSSHEDAGDHTVGNKSDNVEDTTELNIKPRSVAENKLLVYTRAKKRKMFTTENQSINSLSGHHQTQNERSSVFVASRITALRNTQKKRGKRKRVSSGTKFVRKSQTGGF